MSRAYNVVVLTEAADISFGSQCPRGRTKILFVFVDSYLSISRVGPNALLHQCRLLQERAVSTDSAGAKAE